MKRGDKVTRRRGDRVARSWNTWARRRPADFATEGRTRSQRDAGAPRRLLSAISALIGSFLLITLPASAQDPIPELREFLNVSTARYPGMPGNLELEEKVAQRFADSGYQNGAIRFTAPSFVPGKTSLNLGNAESVELHPMHPTLFRPGNFKQKEFDAPLVYLGWGLPRDLDKLKGVELNGTIAVMDFQCGDNWQRFLRFGIRGFIFIGADNYWYQDAILKVYNTEVSVPRFFIDKVAGEKLREALVQAQGTLAHIKAEPSVWKNVELRDLWVVIPGANEEMEKDTFVFVAPIDANCIVPSMAHGAQNGTSLFLLMRMLDHFKKNPPARSVILAAVNAHTHHFVGERMLSWHLLAPQTIIEEVRNILASRIRQQKMFKEQFSRLHFKPETLDTDDTVLEEFRTLEDTSTGKRVKVKGPLQDVARRKYNKTKTDLADLVLMSLPEAEKEKRTEEINMRKAQYLKVLKLFNKISLVEKLTLRTLIEDDSKLPAKVPDSLHSLALLKSYLSEVQQEFTLWNELNLRDLQIDQENGAVRDLVTGKSISMVITLDLMWRGKGVGFCSYNRHAPGDWARQFGTWTTEVARKMVNGEAEVDAASANEKDKGETGEVEQYGLLFNTMTSYGGLPENHYFGLDLFSSIPYFQAAQQTPALSFRSVYTDGGNAFTPIDTIGNLDHKAVSEGLNFLPEYFRAVLAQKELTDSTELPRPSASFASWSINLEALKKDEFSPKPTPDLRVSDSVTILYPNRKGTLIDPIIAGDVTNIYLSMTDDRASTFIYGIREGTKYGGFGPIPSAAFQFDETFTHVLHTVDRGAIQETFKSDVYETSSKILPMFRAEEYPIYDRADPSLVSAGTIMMSAIKPISGRRDSLPRKLGASGIGTESKSTLPTTSGPAAIYVEYKDVAEKREPLKLMTAQQILAINATEKEPEGIGFSSPEELSPDFIAQAVDDMAILNKYRASKMSGVTNKLIDDFIAEGDEAIRDLKKAKGEKDHLEYLVQLYRAVGAESKAYSQLRAINSDMLKAIVFFMGLMLPFCFFTQKLLFNFVKLEMQILAFAGLFILTYLVFRFIHPAFKIALTPEAIFVAFVLGAIGIFVTLIMHNRFDGEMTMLFRSYTLQTGEASTATAGQQAMLIGVNNMKRRRIRTSLTTGTIVLVTFTMLAFSSLSKVSKPTLIRKAEQTPYTGILYQWPGNLGMDEISLRIFLEMFEGRAETVIRRWLMPTGGDRKSSYHMRVDASNGEMAKVLTALGLQTNEDEFIAKIPILKGGRFFSADDAPEIILPTEVAAALKLSAADVGKAKVSLLGEELTVVGILDEEQFRYIKDLNRKSLFPILPEEKAAGSADETSETEGEDDSGVAYVDPSEMVLLPVDIAFSLGALPYSVSIKFEDKAPLWDILTEVLTVTQAKLYLGSREGFAIGDKGKIRTAPGIYYVGSSFSTSIGGLERLIIPLLIAGTIVLNTMLGSVYERRNEIAVYNAIGLNPTNIATFFLAEAFVYGVIGAVGGYLIGQVLAIGLKEFGLVTDINLNFSSLIVVYVITFTIGLVLVSTIYPAYVATRAAVPSGKRKWSLPAHDGQTMQVVFPFIYQPNLVAGMMVYLDEFFGRFTEASLGDQITTFLDKSVGEDEAGRPTYHLLFEVALAPYDLGVTQTVEFNATFDDVVQSYRVHMTTNRVSGQDSNWVTTNMPFLERLRRQLLQWRNLDATEHGVFAKRGEGFFGGT
ncbi:MAG: ABC transporter permease [Planctomycetota bacterium]|nr:ABC transporter permease [Planctomycetota bacterium]